MYHAVDVMNTLPTSANITMDSCAGLSPNEVEGDNVLDITSFYAFGSHCFVHLDKEHRLASQPNVQAAACVYLCKAHHLGVPGHVVWDYQNRRRLTVPRLSSPEWNFYPLRKLGQRHLSSRLTWESPPVEQHAISPSPLIEDANHDKGEDHANDDLPAVIVDSDDAADHAINNSPQVTRYRLKMEGNVGRRLRKVFFVNGSKGDTDYYEGVVHSVTANNKYLVIYSDGDNEEMSHKDFMKFSADVAVQVAALWADVKARNQDMMHPKCNCVAATCVHPWGQQHQKNTDSGTGYFRIQDNRKTTYVPSDIPPAPDATDYYAAMTFGHQMPNVQIDWERSKQNMTDKITAYAVRTRDGKKTAYDPDPKSIDQCKSSPNWKDPEQGNSWWESILTEIENFRRYGVFTVEDADAVAGEKIYPSVINFVTKRTSSNSRFGDLKQTSSRPPGGFSDAKTSS